MNRRSVLAIAAVSGLVIAGPFGFALASHGTWTGTTGALEPDTKFDTSAYMFLEPNHEAVEKIYFNGFILHDNPGAASMPGPVYEVQPEGGTILSPVAVNFAAMLGYWRDCNRDGYIGARVAPMNYGSMSIYPAAVSPVDETICPRGSAYWPLNSETGDPNGYVDEFRHIGNMTGQSHELSSTCVPPNQRPPTNTGLCFAVTTNTFEDLYDVDSNRTRVWADWEIPGGPHVVSQGLLGGHGTYDDSDGTLGYVDDALQRAPSEALGDTWTTKPNVGACYSNPEPLGGPGGTCGLWPAYQAERLVSDAPSNEEEPTPLVTVWDLEDDSDGSGSACDDGFSGTVGGRYVAIPDPQPGVNPNALVQGSVQGTTTNLLRGTNSTELNGDCSDLVFGAGSPESTQAESEFTHRRASDYLSFVPEQRIRTLAAFGFDYAPPDVTGTGIKSGPGSLLLDFGGWFGRNGWTMRPPRAGFGSLTAAHASFYADVHSDAFLNNPSAAVATALPTGKQDAFVYGVEACPAFTTGPSNVNPVNDWECSITEWEKKRAEDFGGTGNYEIAQRALLGESYDLRDVDCYDNSVSAQNGYTADALTGVRLGVADCTTSHA